MKKEIGWIIEEKYGGKIGKKEAGRLRRDLVRLKKGEPLDYIIGWKPFLGCRIGLARRPLIPRPETEYWTQIAVNEMDRDKDIRCLDMFAGSGCAGLAVLKNVRRARVDFAEAEPSLCAQIKENIRMNKIAPARARVFRSDIFSKIKNKYDFILANPPYIPVGLKKSLPVSVKKYERHTSLFGGKDGLAFIKKFLAQAPSHIAAGGKIYMEFSPSQKNLIKKLIKKGSAKSSTFFKDQYGRWRYLVLKY